MPRYPTYPKDLPYKPLASGYEEKYSPIMESTDSNFGLFAQRSVRSLAARRINVTLLLGEERNKDKFHTFWDRDLEKGAGLFRMRARNPEGNWTLHLVQIFNGALTYRQFGFTSIGRYRGDNWEVPTYTVGFEQLIYNELKYDDGDDD